MPLAVSTFTLSVANSPCDAAMLPAVGLGLVVLNELFQLLHLGDQGLYGVPVIRTVAHEHYAPRSRGLLRNIAVDSLLRLGGWSRWLSCLCCLAAPAALATDRARRALRTLAAAHEDKLNARKSTDRFFSAQTIERSSLLHSAVTRQQGRQPETWLGQSMPAEEGSRHHTLKLDHRQHLL